MAKWEWHDEVPSLDEVREALRTVPDVWGIKVADYIDYVLPMTKRQKIEAAGVEKYVPVTKLYMQVAGRVKMIEHAQLKNDWVVTEKWKTLQIDPVVRQVRVRIDELGSRFGVSKLKGGDTAWEKAETAARGRALGAWGIGVLPGSGIASYEEMEVVGVELTEETEEVRRKPKSEVIEQVRDLRVRLAHARQVDIEEMDKKLLAYVLRRWNVQLKIDGETGIDLSPMKDGQLTLMHNDLVQQLKKVEELEEI